MSVDPDAVLPAAYMHKEAKSQVIAFLRDLPTFPSLRRQLFVKWALITGADITAEEIAYVQVLKR